jgi:hypothetical protein
MMTTQQIFHKAIELGYFGADTNIYMCKAIDAMVGDKVITVQEGRAAQHTIYIYMDSISKLPAAMLTGAFTTCVGLQTMNELQAGMKNVRNTRFAVNLSVYSDWELRPTDAAAVIALYKARM